MKIQTIEITDGSKDIIEVQALLHQNDTTAIIGQARRRMIPELESLRDLHIRVLQKAVEWLQAGPVELRDTGGPYAART